MDKEMEQEQNKIKMGRKKYQGVYLNNKILYANRYDYENKKIYKINNSYGLEK